MADTIDLGGLPIVAPGEYDFLVGTQLGNARRWPLPDINNAAALIAGAIDGVVAQALIDLAPILAGLGYLPPVPFASGLNVDTSRFTVDYDGNIYAPAAGTTPFTTTGTFNPTQWRIVQGIVGSDLSAETGAAMVGFRQSPTSQLRTLQERAREAPSALDKMTQAQRIDVTGGAGSIDVTAALNAAFTEFRALRIPKGKYRIDPAEGLRIPSNTTVYFDADAELVSSASSASSYYLLRIRNVENVTIYGGRIVGDRDIHIGGTGESGHGVDLRGARNVKIYGLASDNCWGDGFYLGNDPDLAFGGCDGVTLVDCSADNNRRQGMSIISGKNIKVVRPRITNTNGIAPQAGIDLEPNLATDALQNVSIIDPHTEGNAGPGIVVSLANLDGTSLPLSVRITGHTSVEDLLGFAADSKDVAGLRGFVDHEGGNILRSVEAGIKSVYWDSLGPMLRIIRPYIYRPVATALSATYAHGITIARTVSDTDAPGQVNGNILIVEPSVVDDRTTPFVIYPIRIRDEITPQVNVRVVDPIKFFGATTDTLLSLSGPDVIMYDRLGAIRRTYALTVNENVNGASRQYLYYDNAGTTAGTLQVTLPSAATFKSDLTFEVKSAHTVRVVPATGQTIKFLTGAATATIQSAEVGAMVRLRAVSDTEWVAVAIAGRWTPSVHPTTGVLVGTANPEGSIVADIGTIYQRTSGIGAALYVKQTGAGTNTGWVAK